MIRDAQGHKWFMRFKEYRDGWQWTATGPNCGITSGLKLFPTRAAAEDDARRCLQSHDRVVWSREYIRLVMKRGSTCSLTAEDHEAIRRAAQH
jgi:hypothetical protein